MMLARLSLAFLLQLLAASRPASCYYEGSGVVELGGEDFLKKVRTNSLSVVEFHSDPCPGCKDFSRVYKDLASVFKGLLPVISVSDESLSSRYGVRSFPAVKLFLGNGPNSEPDVVDFKGEKDLDSLVSFTLKSLNRRVKERASKRASKDGEAPKKVVQLTSATFKSTVLEDTYSQWFAPPLSSLRLVKFYAPWCGHCKNLEPEWLRLPKLSKGVKVGRVDCTVHESLCREYDVKGYPTILLFNKGLKSPSSALNYQGARRAKDILEFAKANDKKVAPPSPARTVADLKQRCSGPLCLLFFLPGESPEHLEVPNRVTLRSQMPFAVLYSVGGPSQQWQSVFGVQQVPAVVGLNMAKGVFLPMDSAFSQENVDSFVSSILSGKVSGQRLSSELTDVNSEL